MSSIFFLKKNANPSVGPPHYKSSHLDRCPLLCGRRRRQISDSNSDKDPSAAAAANRLRLEGEATTDNLTCINWDKRKGTERKGDGKMK